MHLQIVLILNFKNGDPWGKPGLPRGVQNSIQKYKWNMLKDCLPKNYNATFLQSKHPQVL